MEEYVSVSNSDWQEISACSELVELEKKELLLQSGKTCKYLYFLEEGLLHFFISKGGDHTTKFFTVAPYVFTSQQSFNLQIPAKENIETLEKSRLWRIEKEDVSRLISELESWNSFANKITLEVQKFTEEILEEIQTETAEARYAKMLETRGDLVQRLPLEVLASYLGIAPQSLAESEKN